MMTKSSRIIILLIAFVLISWAASIDQLMKEGVALRDSGKIDQSITKFEQILKSKSKNPEANYNIGISYYKKADFETALKYLNNALKFGFDPIKTHIALGQVYQTKGDKQQGEFEYNQALQLNPRSPELHTLLAYVYLDNRSFTLAEQEYNNALKIDTAYLPAIVGLGNYYIQKRQSQDALNQYERAKAIDSNYAPTYYNLARYYTEKQDFVKSIENLNRYIQLNPKDPNGYIALAQNYSQGKNFPVAIDNFKLAQANGDTSLSTLKYLGYLYLRTKQPLEAREVLRQITTRSPEDVNAWVDFAKSYYQTDSFASAISAYQQAIKLDSTQLPILAFDIGLAYYQATKYDSSELWFTKEIEQDTLAAGAYINRALAYIMLKKYKESIKDLEKGVRLKPDYAQAHLWLAQVYASQKMDSKAKTEANKVLKLDPKNKEAKELLENLNKPPPVQPENYYDEEEEEEEYYPPPPQQ
jgi:tetratricopeptide (TPR) repeat protein